LAESRLTLEIARQHHGPHRFNSKARAGNGCPNVPQVVRTTRRCDDEDFLLFAQLLTSFSNLDTWPSSAREVLRSAESSRRRIARPCGVHCPRRSFAVFPSRSLWNGSPRPRRRSAAFPDPNHRVVSGSSSESSDERHIAASAFDKLSGCLYSLLQIISPYTDYVRRRTLKVGPLFVPRR
jgi:hypothetical protein